MAYINIEFGEIDLELCQQLLDVYRAGKTPEKPVQPLEALAAVGGVEIPGITLQALKSELAAAVAVVGPDKVRDLLETKFQVKRASDLAKERYAELLQALDAMKGSAA